MYPINMDFIYKVKASTSNDILISLHQWSTVCFPCLFFSVIFSPCVAFILIMYTQVVPQGKVWVREQTQTPPSTPLHLTTPRLSCSKWEIPQFQCRVRPLYNYWINHFILLLNLLREKDSHTHTHTLNQSWVYRTSCI